MSALLRTNVHSKVHLLRNLRSFSSVGDGGRNSDYPAPAEPIPNRPLRRQSRNPNKFPESNRRRENENPKSFRGEIDEDFLERFKLGGFGRKTENPKPDSVDNSNVIQPEKKAENVEEKPSPPEDADEIFKKMKETGLIPNAVAMLDGLCKDGLVQEAMKLFGLMREKGTIPEVVIYSAVVEGFCKAQKFDDAVRIFKKMQSNGVVPNAFSYGVLIRWLCKGKRLEDAYGYTIEMLEAGHSPNLATFTGLIDGYCREKSLEDAQNVIGALRGRVFSLRKKQLGSIWIRKDLSRHWFGRLSWGKKLQRGHSSDIGVFRFSVFLCHCGHEHQFISRFEYVVLSLSFFIWLLLIRISIRL